MILYLLILEGETIIHSHMGARVQDANYRLPLKKKKKIPQCFRLL